MGGDRAHSVLGGCMLERVVANIGKVDFEGHFAWNKAMRSLDRDIIAYAFIILILMVVRWLIIFLLLGVGRFLRSRGFGMSK